MNVTGAGSAEMDGQDRGWNNGSAPRYGAATGAVPVVAQWRERGRSEMDSDH